MSHVSLDSAALLRPEEWISISEATPDALLRDLPLASSGEALVVQAHLRRRNTRLKKLRWRLKEQSYELQQEFRRLEAERAAFERERSEWELERRAQVVSGAPRIAENTAAAGGALPARRDADTDRVNRLFRSPERSVPAASVAPPALPAVAREARDDHAATAQSVAEYMERLLGRKPETPDAGPTDDPEPSSTVSSAEPAPTASADQSVAGESAGPVKPRRRHNVAELRATVGSLRELANHSARAAVAKHSSRKARKSMALILPLMIAAFALGALLDRLGGTRNQAFATTMLGVIACIELVHSFWRAKHRAHRARHRRNEWDASIDREELPQ